MSTEQQMYAELESGSVHISTMNLALKDLERLTSENCCSYAAILSLDLSKRQTNRRDPIFITVYGDSLAHAIDEFKQSDSSNGLQDSDFDLGMVSVLFQATY